MKNKSMASQQKIILEDHGQDFLEWIVKDGIVISCTPFQSQVWVGTQIHNTNIQKGDILNITTKFGSKSTLNYPVEEIIKC